MIEEYHPARDHDKGPGAWCVRGPDDFYMEMYYDKYLSYIYAHLLNHELDKAIEMQKYRVDMQKWKDSIPPNVPQTGDLVAKMYEQMKNE